MTVLKDERAINAVKAALKWAKQHNVRWTASEQKIYSKKHMFSGTLDGMGLVDSCDNATCCQEPFRDRLSLIDFKTSNYLYTEFLYQTAAYSEAIQEEFPDKHIVDRWILRLGKEDGEFDPWRVGEEHHKEDYDGFLACLTLKRIVMSVEERMREQKKTAKVLKKAAKEHERDLIKAAEKLRKATEKAEKKLKQAEEKAKVKAEAKAERERLKYTKAVKSIETASVVAVHPEDQPIFIPIKIETEEN